MARAEVRTAAGTAIRYDVGGRAPFAEGVFLSARGHCLHYHFLA